MNSDFKDLLRALNESKAEYLVVGGHAVMEYTEPRYTKDLDIWIRASRDNAQRVYDALAKFGAPLVEMSAAEFCQEGYVYQIGIAPVRIDILMSIDGVEFDSAWNHKGQIDLFGEPAWVISKMDLIANKRASGRPEDLLDADRLESS